MHIYSVGCMLSVALVAHEKAFLFLLMGVIWQPNTLFLSATLLYIANN